MFLGLPDPHLDPLVRGADPRIWIRKRNRTKMSRIGNTDSHNTVRYRMSTYQNHPTQQLFNYIYMMTLGRADVYELYWGFSRDHST
jgi:hypothetical protein